MVVCDSKNSYLLGIVGSAKKKDANRIMNFALTNETPGSVLKPLAIYAPLIDEGKITWSTVFDDTPVYFYENSKGVLTPYPKNYPDVYSGLTTVSDALAFSKNTVAVKLYKMSDKNKIFRLLKNSFKFDCLVEEETVNGKVYSDLSEAPLALGQLTHGVSLRKLTEAYTVFPRDGVFSEGKSYIYVYDAEGNLVIDKSKSDEERIFKSKTAEIMNKLLSRVTEIGTAKIITLDQTVDTAGKTGTSGNDKDRMFIGYTPYFTAGIWCGYEKNDKSIGKQPKSHIEIWDDIMKDIHSVCINTEIEKSFSENSIVYLPYCKDSGKIFTDTCMLDPRGSRLDYGYFDIHNIPREMCDRHIECLYDEIAGGVANDNCPFYYTKKISLLNIPERSFPMEIIITDAEFVWRDMKGGNYAYSYDILFFYNDLPEGVYVGRSKSKKQFNSYCYIHSD
jgi:penicillin-binding protein 1A